MRFFICFNLLIIVSLIRISITTTLNNFGPYIVTVKKYEFCNGPKRQNLTDVTLDMDADRRSGVFNINYLTNTRIDEIKIVMSTMSGNTQKVLWTYKLNDPCKHFATAAMISYYYKSVNCVVKKGLYKSVVSFDATSKSLMGNNFFYDTYLLKVYILSKEGNIVCMKLFNEFSEKKKLKF